MKRIIGMAMAFILLLSSTSFACANQNEPVNKDDVTEFIERVKAAYSDGYAEGEMLLEDIRDAAVLCGLASASDERGSIFIAKLKDRDGYIVALGGTDITNQEENIGIKEDILSAFNRDNEYKNNVICAIGEYIPIGSDVYIYGYSLGGMVMQQVLADKAIRKNYCVVAAVAIGSPVVNINRQEIVFIEDTSDVVPYLSAGTVLMRKIFYSKDTHIVRDGGFKTTIGAHALSYVDSPVWADVDLFGEVCGGETILIDMTESISLPG